MHTHTHKHVSYTHYTFTFQLYETFSIIPYIAEVSYCCCLFRFRSLFFVKYSHSTLKLEITFCDLWPSTLIFHIKDKSPDKINTNYRFGGKLLTGLPTDLIPVSLGKGSGLCCCYAVLFCSHFYSTFFSVINWSCSVISIFICSVL